MANAELILPLPLPVVTVGALGTAAGHDISYIGNDFAGVVYKSAGGVASGFIEINFAQDTEITRVMLFGLLGAPSNAVIRILASTSAQGPTYAGFASAAMPLYAGSNRLVNGRGVCYLSIAAPPSRYWRIEFSGLANAAFDIGRLVLGTPLNLARNFQFGATFGPRSFATAEFSNRGLFLRRAGPKLRTAGISFQASEKWEIEEQILPLLERAGTDNPVALITDPDAHAMRERRCYFGPIIDLSPAAWRNPRAWEWRADLVSLF